MIVSTNISTVGGGMTFSDSFLKMPANMLGHTGQTHVSASGIMGKVMLTRNTQHEKLKRMKLV